KTLDTLDALERYRGHLYNWYDTTTLEPLQPAYISTVDSGNLLGCFLALGQGLQDKLEEPFPPAAWLAGLGDVAGLVREELARLEPPSGRDREEVFGPLERSARQLETEVREAPADLPAWDALLGRLGPPARALADQVKALGRELGEEPAALDYWAHR